MRRKALASTALLLILSVCPAYAADLPVYKAPPAYKAPPVAAPVPLWTGPYLGVGIGFQSANGDQSENGPGAWPAAVGPLYSNSFTHTSPFVSVYTGYNYQLGNIVLGVEGDVGFSALQQNNIGLGGLQTKFSSDWDASVRLRLGYAVDKFLFYGTGGLAIAEGTFGLDGFTSSHTHLGWTAGAGIEYALSPNWIGRIESRYTSFEKETYATPYGPVGVKWDNWRVGVGLGYKF